MLGIPFVDGLIRAIRPSLYDDIVDRLNYYVTTTMLLFFAIMVSAKQYVGSPIQCWTPAHFKGGWEEFAEDYCFVQNTYFIPLRDQVPQDIPEREEKGQMIGYYQWVPVVLAIQALLFYVPYFFWKSLNFQSGINLKSILQSAVTASTMEPEKRDKELQTLTAYIKESLNVQGQLNSATCSGFWCFRCGRHFGSYVSCLYIFTKFLYLANIVVQFLILNAFLGSDYTLWGVQILFDLIRGREWHISGHFPRVTLCDFEVRADIANIQRNTIQCVLMINMFNEKIYIFLWFWLFGIGIITALNFFYWVLISFPPSARRNFIQKYVRLVEDVTDARLDRARIARFTDNILKPDGVLLLRFVSSHAGDLTSKQLAGNLWMSFANLQRSTFPPAPPKSGYTSEFSSPTRLVYGSKGGDETTMLHTSDDSGASGLEEKLYSVDRDMNGSSQPLMPSAPMNERTLQLKRNGYPGPPLIPPKPPSPVEHS